MYVLVVVFNFVYIEINKKSNNSANNSENIVQNI